MRVAYIHDWLVSYRGGEKVLEALLDLYPDAPLYTLFYDERSMPEAINKRQVIVHRGTNAMKRGRKLLLPLLPAAIEAFDFSHYDLLISTSSCVAKGAKRVSPGKHLCYIHSPMRYIWDQQEEYLAGLRHIPLAAQAVRALTPRLRHWDVQSASRVDRFVVNSSFVGDRVHKFYGRDSTVVAPPVELERFRPGPALSARTYFLAAGALVTYKRFDLAVHACQQLGLPLVIAGQGPAEAALRKIAGPTTTFEIAPSDARMAELLAGAKGLLFPGVEDFGIIAIEAMASGTPVIALRTGGALDYIQPDHTGIFFAEPTAESLTHCLAMDFKPENFDPETLHRYAQGFDRQQFLAKMRAELAALRAQDADE